MRDSSDDDFDDVVVDVVDDFDDDYTKIILLLNEYGVAASPAARKAVKKWLIEFDTDIIAYAIEQADAQGKNTRSYIESILVNLRKRKLDTIEKIHKCDDQWRKNSKNSKFSDKDSSVYKPVGTDYSDLERRMNAVY